MTKYNPAAWKKFKDAVFERDSWCMASGYYGTCYGIHTAHHIKSTGSGGSNDLENGIRLCFKHHDMAHRKQISKKWLRERIKNESTS